MNIRSPCSPHRTHCRREGATVLLTALTVGLLPGCGGGGDDEAGSVGSLALSSAGAAMKAADAAEPADPGARTRLHRYATRAQADRLSSSDVLQLTVDCCTADAADLAVLTAYGLQAARDLPSSTPVLVSGTDLRVAAVVVDRLGEAGFSRVLLVTR